MGEDNRVKISDFGLSRALAKDDSYYKLGQTVKLPVKWMALEALLYQKFSTYSDGQFSEDSFLMNRDPVSEFACSIACLASAMQLLARQLHFFCS